jgi:hypothetical protein
MGVPIRRGKREAVSEWDRRSVTGQLGSLARAGLSRTSASTRTIEERYLRVDSRGIALKARTRSGTGGWVKRRPTNNG